MIGGGGLQHLSIDNRKEPCVRVFREIFFDFRGLAYLCCNTFPDTSQPIGDIQKQDIWEIYAHNYAWRKILFTYGNKPKPCKTCRDEDFYNPKDNHTRYTILHSIREK